MPVNNQVISWSMKSCERASRGRSTWHSSSYEGQRIALWRSLSPTLYKKFFCVMQCQGMQTSKGENSVQQTWPHANSDFLKLLSGFHTLHLSTSNAYVSSTVSAIHLHQKRKLTTHQQASPALPEFLCSTHSPHSKRHPSFLFSWWSVIET